MLLLTTLGHGSGERRTTPMMYLADDDDPDIAATAHGLSGPARARTFATQPAA